jgi:branched-subunit amino acid ABC-type transport system permease component
MVAKNSIPGGGGSQNRGIRNAAKDKALADAFHVVVLGGVGEHLATMTMLAVIGPYMTHHFLTSSSVVCETLLSVNGILSHRDILNQERLGTRHRTTPVQST